MLTDTFGRTVDYLRLSITDRCDLRCTYCMPEKYRGYQAPDHWLTLDEIDRLAGIFVDLGVGRIRLTGGEPLLRARIGDLAGRIRRRQGLRDLSISTNGTRLVGLAPQLRAAGVDRLNVSLDTLSPERFARLTGRDVLGDVLHGLDTARACGFRSIKINMVWLPDINGDEIDAMIDYCVERGFVLRLIETMPMGDAGRRFDAQSLQPLIAGLRERFGLVDCVLPGGGPARYLATPDHAFSIGFITPLSQHFCKSCNRVRVSVDGTLYLCLGQENKVELRPLMRAGATDADICEAIRAGLRAKPERHEFREQPRRIERVMSATGG